ncbi:MAG: hypothetical protein MJ003_04505 [Paludibacteraceae bacterium]|nr:hypothetical protein [Paludibacteraceae bacterium]
MKKTVFIIAALMTAMCAMAKEKFYVYMNDGTTDEYTVADCDSISFTKPKAPTRPECQTALDADDNWIKIGEQYWLKVNTKCIEYDTESEAYVAGITTISTSSSRVNTPYYTDPTTVSTGKPDYMSEEQWGNLGMLYNWAAAVGLADGTPQETPFTGNRQGICPNGSHVPSVEEWNTLRDYLGGKSVAGKKMKTSTGWQLGTGEGDNGFAALPAGCAKGSNVQDVGGFTYYWSSDAKDSDTAYYRYLLYYNETLSDANFNKGSAYSVRCLRD